MALPTNQPIAPTRNTPSMGTGDPKLRDENQEAAFHPIYHYAVITDAVEGLILVNVDALADREPRNNFLHRAVTWNPGDILKGARHITLGGHLAYIAADAGLVVVDLNDPLKPRLAKVVPLLDVTKLDDPRPVPGAVVPLADARRVYVARTYAYVAAGAEGLVIVDVKRPEHPTLYQRVTFGGKLNDAQDVIVASTNASLFAYVADGRNGLKVIQLTSPASQPNFYGFSPAPKPELIAWARTPTPALALSKGLDRDRAVDETGGQIAVFGRLGSRPFTRAEMEGFFIDWKGAPYRVSNAPSAEDFVVGR